MNVYLLFSFISFIIYLQAALFIFFVYPRTKIRLLLGAGCVALGIHSLSVYLSGYLTPLSEGLFAERLAGISFIATTLIFNVLIYYLHARARRLLQSVFGLVMLPFAIVLTIKLLMHPDAISYFNRTAVTWGHFELRSSLWNIIFILYNFFVIVLTISQLLLWRIEHHGKKERRQSGIVLAALIFFIASCLITDFLLPRSELLTITPLFHIAGLSVLAAFLFVFNSPDFNPFSEEMLSKLFISRFRVFALFFDQGKRLYTASQYALNILGYKKYELIDLGTEGLFANPDIYQQFLLTSFSVRTQDAFIIPLKKKDGTIISVKFIRVEIIDSVKKHSGFVLAGYDHDQEMLQQANVEELKRQIKIAKEENNRMEMLLQRRRHDIDLVKNRIFIEEQQTKRASLQMGQIDRERQDLVSEMHHRVKNNLQIALSLTEFARSDGSLGGHESALLKSIVRHIRTLSMIHEDFYSSARLSKINFGGYLKTLIGQINRNHQGSPGVLFRINSGDEYLKIKSAIVCALIVYELVTNALQHAFPSESCQSDRSSFVPIIFADFHRSQQWYELVVRDNGTGIDEGVVLGGHSGAGMKIIKILVEVQLNGEFSAINSFGTFARIRFPAGDLKSGLDR